MRGTQRAKCSGGKLQGGTSMSQGRLEPAPVPKTPTLLLFVQPHGSGQSGLPDVSPHLLHLPSPLEADPRRWSGETGVPPPCPLTAPDTLFASARPSSPQVHGEWPLPRSTGKPPLPGQREAQPAWSPAPSAVFAEEAENKGPAHRGEQGLGAIAPGTSSGLSPSVSGPPVGATSLCLVCGT